MYIYIYIYIRMVCLAQKPTHAVGWVWEPKKVIQPMGESRHWGPRLMMGLIAVGEIMPQKQRLLNIYMKYGTYMLKNFT
jgi:hypothetical protein